MQGEGGGGGGMRLLHYRILDSILYYRILDSILWTYCTNYSRCTGVLSRNDSHIRVSLGAHWPTCSHSAIV